jgi:hypothetical protein
MASPQHSKVPLWLRLVLSMATVALIVGFVDLSAAAIGGRLKLPENAPRLATPLALALLGFLSWTLALPRLRIVSSRLAASTTLNGFIALCGVLSVLFAGAELVTAIADAGLIALLDVYLVLTGLCFIVLGTWCAVAGAGNLLGSRRCS